MSIVSVSDVSHLTYGNTRSFSYCEKNKGHFQSFFGRLVDKIKPKHPHFAECLLSSFASQPQGWHIDERCHAPRSLYMPTKEFLTAKASYYQEKYDIKIKIVSIEDLSETLSSLTDEELALPYLGLVVLVQKDEHGSPALIKMKKEDGKIICEECVLMDADDTSEDSLFEIYAVLQEFGLEAAKVVKTLQNERQADGVSCKTGSMSLLRNALLDLKHHGKATISELYPFTEKEEETFLDLPPSWTWGEQIFHYDPARLAALNPRDLFSSKEEKRAHPRTVAEMREAYKKAVKVTAILSSTTSKEKDFEGCILPEGFFADKPKIKYTSTTNLNTYLQCKGLRDCMESDKYMPSEESDSDLAHKDKKTRIANE